ncbi:hypothetical protein KUTeg_022232 [Tegillarca granosa]|uniref:G-protein coupled receptors family 1 profile domain-containing protein n=1 Tax=Tegillarca granosa TaxID=220873 RepID=A0ABQ9E5L3_TEGGR|nr:hypothetical protein KUTeg_022232 [Tegillarca granosa]
MVYQKVTANFDVHWKLEVDWLSRFLFTQTRIRDSHVKFGRSTASAYYNYSSNKTSTLYKQTSDKSRDVITQTNTDRSMFRLYRDVISELECIKTRRTLITLEKGGYLPYQIKSINTTTEGQYLTVYNDSSIVLDFTLVYKQRDTKPESCVDDFAKCLDINNNWKCLTKPMICDGIVDCMAELDEYYCCYGNDMCGTKTIELTFIPATNKINSSFVSKFTGWHSHPISNILDASSFSSLQFSLKGRYFDFNSIERVFDFNNVLNYHIFKQFTGPGVFRNVNQTPTLFISGRIENLAGGMFKSFSGLRNLTISNTAIAHIEEKTFYGLKQLLILAITQNQHLVKISDRAFNPLKSLRKLSLSYNKLEILAKGLLDKLVAIEWLDLMGNNIKLTSNIFKFNKNLTYIFSDTSVFCCDSVKPPSVTDENCVAPRDEISSCKNLIENMVLSILLWIFRILALFGNPAVCIYRFVTRRKQRNETFSIFVANLGLSDAIMGLYMLIIAAHDLSYKSKYVWKEYDWKNSTLCTISGAIAYTSSEASVMFISLITIDRFLAVKYPMGRVRISMKSAKILTVLSWITSIIMAVVPVTVYPMFYSYSGVCIGFPLTDHAQQGWLFSVSIQLEVYIALNIYQKIFRILNDTKSVQIEKFIRL